MPPTVFRPVSATLPASRTASVSGSWRSPLGWGASWTGGRSFGRAEPLLWSPAFARAAAAAPRVPDFARAVVFGCAALGRRDLDVSAGPADAAAVEARVDP